MDAASPAGQANRIKVMPPPRRVEWGGRVDKVVWGLGESIPDPVQQANPLLAPVAAKTPDISRSSDD